MGRHQCKNSFNNLKSNKVTPKPGGHSTGRLYNPIPEEAEKKIFECNFMRMMEIFNENIKNSLKWRNRQTKN